MDFRDHVRAIWALRRLVVALALLATVAFLVLRVATPVVASAQATLSISTPVTDTSGTTESLRRLAERYVLLGQTSTVRRAAAEQVGGLTPATVGGQVTLTAAETAGLLNVVATGSSPAEAARLADAFGTAVSTAVQQEQAQQEQRDVEALQTRLQDVTARLEALQGEDATALATRSALEARSAALTEAIAGRSLALPLTITRLGDVTSVPVSRNLPRLAVVTFLVAALLVSEALIALYRVRKRLIPGGEVRAIQELTGAPVVPGVHRSRAGDVDDQSAAQLYFALADLHGSPLLGLTFLSVDTPDAGRAVATAVARVVAELGTPSVLAMSDAHDGDSPEPTSRNQHERLDPGRTSSGSSVVVTRLRPGVDHGGPEQRVASRSLRVLLDQGSVLAVGGPESRHVTEALSLAREVGGVVLVVDPARVRPSRLQDFAELLTRAGSPPLATAVLSGRSEAPRLRLSTDKRSADRPTSRSEVVR